MGILILPATVPLSVHLGMLRAWSDCGPGLPWSLLVLVCTAHESWLCMSLHRVHSSHHWNWWRGFEGRVFTPWELAHMWSGMFYPGEPVDTTLPWLLLIPTAMFAECPHMPGPHSLSPSVTDRIIYGFVWLSLGRVCMSLSQWTKVLEDQAQGP